MPDPEIEPDDFGEIAHWIAGPMKNVGTIDQFHEVVERAQKALKGQFPFGLRKPETT